MPYFHTSRQGIELMPTRTPLCERSPRSSSTAARHSRVVPAQVVVDPTGQAGQSRTQKIALGRMQIFAEGGARWLRPPLGAGHFPPTVACRTSCFIALQKGHTSSVVLRLFAAPQAGSTTHGRCAHQCKLRRVMKDGTGAMTKLSMTSISIERVHESCTLVILHKATGSATDE